MNPQSICELVGLFSTCAACCFFVWGCRRARLSGSKQILSVLLLVNLGNYTCNAVEWSKITTQFDLDAIEDTLDLLTPLAWWFFLYSCCQHVVSSRLRETIAARQEMEKTVRSSETRLRAVVENVPVYICSIDPGGKVLFANGSFRGVKSDSVIGMHLSVLLPSEADSELARALVGVFRNAEPQSFEILEPRTNAASDASWYSCRLAPVCDDDDVVSAIFVATNVSDVKRAEEELRVSEAHYRTLVEHAPEAIIVLDVSAEHFVDANKRAEQLFGLDREALLDSSWLDVSPPLQPDDNRASAEVLQQLVEQALDGHSRVVRWTFRNASKELVPCEVRLIRQPSSHHKLVRGSVTPTQPE